MKKTYTSLVPLLVLVGSGVLAGCEVVAEFDRTKIDAGEALFDGSTTDGTVADANKPDTATDATSDALGTDGGDAAADGVAPDADAASSDAADASSDTSPNIDAADAAPE